MRLLAPESRPSHLISYPAGDCEKMKRACIDRLGRRQAGGRMYGLDFFAYVVGAAAGGMGSFRGIAEAGVRGSAIRARDLLLPHGEVEGGRLSPMAAWRMLKCNRRVARQDIEREAAAAALDS